MAPHVLDKRGSIRHDAARMSDDTPYLVWQARRFMHVTQKELAQALGTSSLRTVQRWEAGHGQPSPREYQVMADAVRAENPDLAALLDARAPRPVVVPAPAAPAASAVPDPPAVAPAPDPSAAPGSPGGPEHRPAAAEPRVSPALLVSAVVCAAAEAMALPPQAVRSALRAAFACALEAGLSLEAVVDALSRGEPPHEAHAAPRTANHG